MLNRSRSEKYTMKKFLLQAMSSYPLKIPGLLLNKLSFSLLALHLAGCASQEQAPIQIIEPIPVAVSQDEGLKIEIARLEKLIAEKDELIKSQKIRQQNQAQVLREVNKEATRAQVKLHRLATKPSTASAIAEIEVALDHLKQVKISAADQILQIQAQHLVETASVFYAKDQYAQAMNHVAQAKHLIGLITDPNLKKISTENNSLLEFLTPIKLRTKANVNLRKEPNTRAPILATLKKDATLIASASQGSWLRVQTESNQGWVLSTTLEIEKNHNP
ncbi:SH3 type 3 domain protein [Nitrosomonas sp. Is79A3]|uniref:SH3 domain-containing protein n=1 Tax=Nitrosomonas sp. (strain Is79A3) TaxID=261292 RepID=UPI000215D00C